MSDAVERGLTSNETAEKFWEYVDRNGPVPSHAPLLGECWEWTGRQWPNGYGMVLIGRNRRMGAHQVSFIMENGWSSERSYVLHKCDNRLCVRPDHLVGGTQAENMADAENKGRWTPIHKGDHRCKPRPRTLAAVRAVVSGEMTMSQASAFYGMHNANLGRAVERLGPRLSEFAS